LTLPAPHSKGAALDFPSAYEEMVPAPWLRAASSGWRRRERGDEFHREVVHDLRVLTEPKADASPDGRYPMAQMTDQESRLFALLFLPDLERPHNDEVDAFVTSGLFDPRDAAIRVAWAPDGESAVFYLRLPTGRMGIEESGIQVDGLTRKRDAVPVDTGAP